MLKNLALLGLFSLTVCGCVAPAEPTKPPESRPGVLVDSFRFHGQESHRDPYNRSYDLEYVDTPDGRLYILTDRATRQVRGITLVPRAEKSK